MMKKLHRAKVGKHWWIVFV